MERKKKVSSEGSEFEYDVMQESEIMQGMYSLQAKITHVIDDFLAATEESLNNELNSMKHRMIHHLDSIQGTLLGEITLLRETIRRYDNVAILMLRNFV